MGMFDNIRFPYFNLQQLNLDWILNEVKRIAGFMPQDGNVGDILTRKSDGAAWEQPAAVQVDIDGLPGDTQIMDNDELIFYDVSAQANRKIKPPDLMDSMASNAYPSMNGTASAGTSKKPARYDHVHPTDTSRAKASYFSSDHLKVANGGTGAGNAGDARTNLGLGDVATENIVPVVKGGTGATDAATARTNLGITTATTAALDNGDSGITQYGHVIYDPVSHIVTLNLSARSSSDIATTALIATIPSGYRPTSSLTRVTMLLVRNDGVGVASFGSISTTGEIHQNYSGNVREIYCSYSYTI